MQQFSMESRSGLVLVHCTGQITFEVTDGLKRELSASLDKGESTGLAMDLSEVTFMDSSGIGLLAALHSRMKGEDRRFVLVAPSQQVCKVLKLVKLYDFFEVIQEYGELDPA